jgi:hypothetical protein
MAQHRDVVEHVQVGAALHVDQVVAPAAFDMRRLLVVVLLRAGEAGVAAGQQACASASGSAAQSKPSSAEGDGHRASQAAAALGVAKNGAARPGHRGTAAR